MSNMKSSNFASTFAPYAPPPDDPSYPSSSTSRPTARAWFPSQSITSYQSGGIPTFNTSQAGGAGAAEDEEAEGSSAWETRFGMRVDMMAACAYILGPLSALLLLILETHNDYVRFHAYQSALLSTPLLLLRIWASMLGFAPFLRTLFTLLLLIPSLYMTWRAYIDAARNGLSRYLLPGVGPLAERWVSEE